MPHEPSEDDVLNAFAMEEEASSDVLKRYIALYPAHAVALIDLFHDLQLSDLEQLDVGRTELEAQGGMLETKSASLEAKSIDPAAEALSGGRLKAVARDLGLPRTFISGFRDGRVRFGTIPGAFLVNLAEALRVRVDQLADHLMAPQSTATRLAFKADGIPGAMPQASFEDYVNAALLTPEQLETVRALARHGDRPH